MPSAPPVAVVWLTEPVIDGLTGSRGRGVLLPLAAVTTAGLPQAGGWKFTAKASASP
ncbi:hypothetical protein ACQPYK_02210 [Streptosporangium sp. CA-135522]|uniref:hypothetical protein n=1 Tax=Streptosporangium sp. CA-135522 TaxID=3240072 RepID=UPI003D8C4CDA